MARLCGARLLVACVPFNRWRQGLGYPVADGPSQSDQRDASQLARDVEWAARRLPLEMKCLPRAMALSWMLRRRRIGHAVVIAVRPSGLRRSPDSLHAWVEVGGEIILGDLPGPWIETARLGL